jgi:Peptidase A4 family
MATRVSVLLAGLTLTAGTLAISAPASAASAGHYAAPASAISAAQMFRQGDVFREAPGTTPQLIDGHLISYGNWGGYVVTGANDSVKTTSATWTQTAVSCPSGDDSSPWIGIDGFNDNTVEQTGTDGDCNGSKPSYYAWYEMYPRNTVVINEPISPGDQFTGTVTFNGGKSYTLTLANVTDGWTYTTTQTLKSDDNSAEAVLEQDGPSLADFGTLPFSDFTVNGSTAVNPEEMEVGTSAGDVCQTTSAFTTGAFTTTWVKANCGG